ncbi:hypothetical protein [Herpetosiphon llansteffanensis]|uniref:hypothetical protein n=1 Tax=Herpetosiphon llansteffanensis TaxID=2094568 RepID=UPI000D7D0AA4|nr:hypothetical protein [Herpetosiphon llansteffanensis]
MSELDNKSQESDSEILKLTIEAWKKTIDVQQHFNDLEVRIRNFAVTVITAVIAATGTALKDHVMIYIPIFGETALAAWFVVAGLAAWTGFYVLDRSYHKLLLGAVQHGEYIEKLLKDKIPSIVLTTTISKYSRERESWWEFRSLGRIRTFYVIVGVMLLGLALVLYFGVDASSFPNGVTSTPLPTLPAIPSPTP